jgi:Protein kinase domain
MKHRLKHVSSDRVINKTRLVNAAKSYVDSFIIVKCPYSIQLRLPLIGTCKTLLQQANLLYEKEKELKSIADDGAIIALQTPDNIECIDYYLTQLDRAISCLRNSEVLNAVTSNRSKSTGTLNYIYIKKVGEGGFSSVYEVRNKISGKIYAMKVVEKAQITNKEKLAQIVLEKNIMQSLNHPFLLKSYKAFATV